MAIKAYTAVTPGRRHRMDSRNSLAKHRPLKRLTQLLSKNSGRNSTGTITVRHQGGRKKRFYREVDFKRVKDGITGVVKAIEYDPNRSAHLALVYYKDGDKRYIIASSNTKVGDVIVSGIEVEPQAGNAMPLSTIPVGTTIHNIELRPGHGATIVRSAGTSAIILSRDENQVIVRLPSGEVRIFDPRCRATIGQVSNVDHGNEMLGKAGRSRHMGIRPAVRGTAMDPRSHPHGGGEGRSGIGLKAPKSVYGKRTLGVRTRAKKKHSNKYIVSRRKK